MFAFRRILTKVSSKRFLNESKELVLTIKSAGLLITGFKKVCSFNKFDVTTKSEITLDYIDHKL